MAIYRAGPNPMLRDSCSDDKVLVGMIAAMKMTTKMQRDVKVTNIFDLSLIKKAAQDLIASGWNP